MKGAVAVAAQTVQEAEPMCSPRVEKILGVPAPSGDMHPAERNTQHIVAVAVSAIP